MAFKRQGKAKKAENKIEVIQEVKPAVEHKITASAEETILCPHCKKVIGTKIGQIYQVLDQRLVSLKGTVCPKCAKEINQ